MRNALFGSRHCPIGILGDDRETKKFLDSLLMAIVKKRQKPMFATSEQRSVIIGLIPRRKLWQFSPSSSIWLIVLYCKLTAGLFFVWKGISFHYFFTFSYHSPEAS